MIFAKLESLSLWGMVKDLIYISDNMQIKAGGKPPFHAKHNTVINNAESLTRLYTSLPRIPLI